jgi:hypothetical protein
MPKKEIVNASNEHNISFKIQREAKIEQFSIITSASDYISFKLLQSSVNSTVLLITSARTIRDFSYEQFSIITSFANF